MTPKFCGRALSSTMPSRCMPTLGHRRPRPPDGCCHLITAHFTTQRSEAQEATVVGSGLIGLTSAYELQKAGYRVTVIDRQRGSGLECSFSNACLIGMSQSCRHTPSWSALSKLIISTAESATSINFAQGLKHIPFWHYSALYAATGQGNLSQKRNEEINSAIYDLSKLSVDELEKLIGTEAAFKRSDYTLLKEGLLFIFRSKTGLQNEINLFQHAGRRMGSLVNVLSADEVLQMEPSLKGMQSRLAGGLYFDDCRVGDPSRFSETLQNVCLELGVNFRFNTTVSRLRKTGGRVSSLETMDGQNLPTDGPVVLACGSFTPHLASSAGVRLPICPAKGYGLTFDLKKYGDETVGQEVRGNIDRCGRRASLSLKRPILDGDTFTVMSPLPDQRMRVTSIGEAGSYTYGPAGADPKIMQRLIRNASDVFPGLQKLADEAKDIVRDKIVCDTPSEDPVCAWTGLRPLSPDGLPLIGKIGPYDNLFTNVGHGSMGWSTCMASAKMLAASVTGQKPPLNLTPFDPKRFELRRLPKMLGGRPMNS